MARQRMGTKAVEPHLILKCKEICIGLFHENMQRNAIIYVSSNNSESQGRG